MCVLPKQFMCSLLFATLITSALIILDLSKQTTPLVSINVVTINTIAKECVIDVNNSVLLGSFVGIPLYYYKKGISSTNAILSIATMCDINRLSSARQMAINFNGPISIAVYTESLEDEIKNKTICNKLIEYFNNIQNKYDIYISILYPNYSSIYYKSLKLDKPGVPLHARFPENAARNLAVSQIKTKYVSCWDIDFIFMSASINLINSPYSTNSIINGNNKFINNTGIHETKIWIIPCFEWVSYYMENKYRHENRFVFNNKTELLTLIKLKYIQPFHVDICVPGHFCTLYSKWYNMTKNYKIEYCNKKYEPYILFETQYAKNKYKWNNDYIGRGKNRVEQITRLAYDCFHMEVIHDFFIIHDWTDVVPRGSQYQTKMEKKYTKELKAHCDTPNECWNHNICH